MQVLSSKSWRRPTLPRVCSTIGADGLNFSVRNGKRWNPHAITTLVSFSPLCVRCVKVRSFLEVQNAVSRAVVPLEASSVSFYSRPRLRSAFSCVKAWLRGFVPAAAVLPRCLGATRSLGGVAFARKAVGILVLLGWDIAALTPATYLRRSLQRPLYGDLILRGASCLDAFSTYPCRRRLPGSAAGATTGSPELRPTRSSRTSVGSSQISCAHNR